VFVNFGDWHFESGPKGEALVKSLEEKQEVAVHVGIAAGANLFDGCILPFKQLRSVPKAANDVGSLEVMLKRLKLS